MVYDVYHDESKEEAFWHIFLFVPRDTKSIIINCLSQAKCLSNFKGQQLNFKNLRSDASFQCTKAWLSILVAAFQQKAKNRLEPFYLGRTKFNERCQRRTGLYRKFTKPPKCKVAIFHLKNKHKDMTGHLSDLSKIETTFRMGLQGASHFLFSPDDSLEIKSIFLDREEHYRIAYKQDFDSMKVMNKLEARFREYCTLCSDCTISGENINEDDRIFLDLADLFLGAFRFGTIKPSVKDCVSNRDLKKYNLCKVIYPLIGRLNEGYARMQNSRFERFGTFSSAWIENDQWQFENMTPEFLRTCYSENLCLPFS